MKQKWIFLLIGLLLVAGCSGCSWKGELEEIPMIEFESLEYHRAGNITSADIVATGSKLDGCTNKIESLSIKGDYGPAVNFNIKIKGYKRQIIGCEEKTHESD